MFTSSEKKDYMYYYYLIQMSIFTKGMSDTVLNDRFCLFVRVTKMQISVRIRSVLHKNCNKTIEFECVIFRSRSVGYQAPVSRSKSTRPVNPGIVSMNQSWANILSDGRQVNTTKAICVLTHVK